MNGNICQTQTVSVLSGDLGILDISTHREHWRKSALTTKMNAIVLLAIAEFHKRVVFHFIIIEKGYVLEQSSINVFFFVGYVGWFQIK